ncbi:MAG: ribosome recycling factor [Chitinispirillales bacterium]|jgi:ribosome recycling factor|nr:ribosome recycling factor [Chitinispirillales bacterium]
MGAMEDIKKETEDRMQKTLDSLKKDLTRVRTGRATPALLDGINIDYYGNPAPINQVANISVPEARMIIVQPWEKSMLSAIEKAIQASNLGLNPQNDGNQIRIPIPPLSEERRKDLFKTCGKTAEECKVAMRNVRRDSNEKLKKAQKDKAVTEDQEKKGLDDVQKVTDKYIKLVDEQLALKEKEIMEV